MFWTLDTTVRWIWLEPQCQLKLKSSASGECSTDKIYQLWTPRWSIEGWQGKDGDGSKVSKHKAAAFHCLCICLFTVSVGQCIARSKLIGGSCCRFGRMYWILNAMRELQRAFTCSQRDPDERRESQVPWMPAMMDSSYTASLMFSNA